MPANIILDISGMSCTSCVSKVEKVLSEVPGVSDVTVNLASKKAMFSYLGSTINQDALVKAVESGCFAVRFNVKRTDRETEKNRN